MTCRGARVVGYYSLAYGSVAQAEAPPALTKGIGKYPIPLMIAARLAVDVQEKGQGLGKALLKPHSRSRPESSWPARRGAA